MDMMASASYRGKLQITKAVQQAGLGTGPPQGLEYLDKLLCWADDTLDWVSQAQWYRPGPEPLSPVIFPGLWFFLRWLSIPFCTRNFLLRGRQGQSFLERPYSYSSCDSLPTGAGGCSGD